jgi:4-hydroxysphinganine ceramide fatty acyl 2-hydroxylase
MPGRTLPTFTSAEVESHDNNKSCYVTVGSKVYDITSFVDDHPGGGDLVLEYAGKDVREILRDAMSHEHSEAAYEILEDNLVGFIASESTGKGANINGVKTKGVEITDPVFASTGMSREEDLSIETDYSRDYKTHKFLDLNKPLLMQLWNSGFSKEFYLEQIHRPRHYKGGESAPLFGNFLEPLSKTAWYVVPMIWLPPVTYGTLIGFSGLGNVPAAAVYWLGGLFLWTLIEYILHRFLFHIDKYDLQHSFPVVTSLIYLYLGIFPIIGLA